MDTVADILDGLKEVAIWLDGESLASIRARLTPVQFAGLGDVFSCIDERGAAPWVLRVRVEQYGVTLFEVTQRLPKALTHAEVEAWIQAWGTTGAFQNVTIIEAQQKDSFS